MSWSGLTSHDSASAGPHLEVGVGFDEGVVDVFEDLEGEVGAGLVGVELVGFAGDRGHEATRRVVAEVDLFAG